MSAPELDPEEVALDGLRLLARLVADAWREGGLPPDREKPGRKRSLPVEVVLVPASALWDPDLDAP